MEPTDLGSDQLRPEILSSDTLLVEAAKTKCPTLASSQWESIRFDLLRGCFSMILFLPASFANEVDLNGRAMLICPTTA